MARKDNPTYITEKEPFPQRLKELLEETKTTQTSLAKSIGCTRQAVSLYATGQSTPDIKILLKISEYFNVSTDYLLGKSDATTSNVDELKILEYMGLSEKAMIKMKFFLQSDCRDCFIALLESEWCWHSIEILNSIIFRKKEKNLADINERKKIKAHIEKSVHGNENYNLKDSSFEKKVKEYFVNANNNNEKFEFYQWKAFKALYQCMTHFINEIVTVPEELKEDFHTFLKECISNGKHTRETE